MSKIVRMGLLSNKVVLITGATRGIGLGIATECAKQGADIAFTYANSAEKAVAIQKDLTEKYGVKAKGYKSNAASLAASEELITEVLADFQTINVLINNAGITRDTLLMRMSEEQWDEVIDVNLKSVFNLTKACLRTFLKNKSGSIINMTSVVGVNGNGGQSNYAASKAGIIGFTKSIAKEIGSRSIRCNAIAPGFIQTEMTAALDENVVKSWVDNIPLKRGGTPEDVANACVFLASDMSSYITGQTLHVCGGMLT